MNGCANLANFIIEKRQRKKLLKNLQDKKLSKSVPDISTLNNTSVHKKKKNKRNNDDHPPPLPASRPPISNPNGSSGSLPFQGPPPQAPGTCTLPRRALMRDDTSRYRSPSNPPPNSRQPPPYAHHQHPTQPKRTYQPPPPPRRETSQPDLNIHEQQNSSAEPDTQQWGSSHWIGREVDSGFESMNSRNGELSKTGNFPTWENKTKPPPIPSKSTEDLLTASRVSTDISHSTPPKGKLARTPYVHVTNLKTRSNIPSPEAISCDSVYPNESHFDMSYTNENRNESTRTFSHPDRPNATNNNVQCNTKPPYKYVSNLKRYTQRENENTFDDDNKRPGRAETSPLFIEEVEDPKEDGLQVRITKVPLPNSLYVKDTEQSRPIETSHDLAIREPCSPTKNKVNARLSGILNNTEDLCQENDRRGDGCPASTSWTEWTHQLQAYVAWVNSQLRKKPGRPLISDLRRDFLNGIVFADLVEIIAGETVAGLNRNAETASQCKDNLDRIFQFMAAKRIRMTHITSKEVAEGNLKSIMRVILALASHYKPQSVRNHTYIDRTNSLPRSAKSSVTTHDVGVGPDIPIVAPDKTPCLGRKVLTDTSAESESALRRQPSLTHSVRSTSPLYENLPKRAAQGRWAYDSLRASHKFSWNSTNTNRETTKTVDDTLSTSFTSSKCTSLDTSLDVDNFRDSPTSRLKQTKPAALDFWQRQEDETPKKSSVDSESDPDPSPFRYHTIHRISGRRKLPQIPGKASPALSNTSRVATPQSIETVQSSNFSETSRQRKSHSSTESSSEENREPEGRSQNSSPATSLGRVPVVENWSKSDQWKEEDSKESITDFGMNSDFPASRGGWGLFSIASCNQGVSTVGLNNAQDLHGTYVTLDSTDKRRTSFRRKISARFKMKDGDSFKCNGDSAPLRQEVIRHILARQALESDKLELVRNVQQKDHLISDLRKQILQKEKTLQLQKTQFDEAYRNLQNTQTYRLSSENSRIQAREELHLVREAIGALRSNFRETDPNQHTLDTLEQAIAILIERAPTPSENNTRKEKSQNTRSSETSHTKVIYFTERTVTPFMSTINKKLGEVTLRDFKTIFDRPGYYRFHFKNHDPEYGLVKEEIMNDDDILPGVDGKIIAWVEDDIE